MKDPSEQTDQNYVLEAGKISWNIRVIPVQEDTTP